MSELRILQEENERLKELIGHNADITLNASSEKVRYKELSEKLESENAELKKENERLREQNKTFGDAIKVDINEHRILSAENTRLREALGETHRYFIKKAKIGKWAKRIREIIEQALNPK